MAAIKQIEDFSKFARRLSEQEGLDLTMDEIYDRWRGETHRSEDAIAIMASVNDFLNGERGQLAEEALAELRAERAASKKK